MVVLYSGSNDIAGGRKPEQVLAEFRIFVKKIHDTLPETKIVYISIHTPPVCYPGNGYSLPAPPTRYLAPVEARGRPMEFWVAKFNRTNTPVSESIRVFWTWSAGGTWHAPDWPRVTFISVS